MKYSNIQKVIAAAMLVAFTLPSSLAVSLYDSYAAPSSASMVLTGGARITDKNDKITLSLRDSDVKQVLRMFADKVGKNVVFHSSVEGKVTLDLVDMPINDAFNLVMQISNLSSYVQGNTLIVLSKNSSDNATFAKQEMMLFPVKYVSASKIADFLNNNVLSQTGETATVNAATNEIILFGKKSDSAIVQKVIDQLDREPLTRTFSVNHTTPAEMADMICNMLLPSRGSSSGKSSGGAKSGGGATGFAADIGGSSALKLGEGVVACSVSQTATSSSAPFDVQNLAVSYFPQRGTIMIMGGSEAQANMIERFIKTNDIKQPQAYLEVQIVELNEQGSKDLQNEWKLRSKAWNADFNSSGFSGGRLNSADRYVPVTYHIWAPTDANGNPTWSYNEKDGKVILPTYTALSGMSKSPYGSNLHISWYMNYLIQNQKARVLANPKLIITNGQESVIDLTQDYIEKVTSEFLSTTTSGTVGAVQRTYTIGEDKGIKVTLTPFISPEGYVTLNIKPEYATEAGKVYAAGETGSDELAATLLSRRNLDLKNIRIKDGETLVIGGMVQEEDSKTVRKVPVLGDLPLIGAAFRSTNTTKVKTELIIMITPRIIDDGEGSIADSL